MQNVLVKARDNLKWVPGYAWQRLVRRPSEAFVHLIIGLADHFEPAVMPGYGRMRASRSEQERRLERWCREYPKLVNPWRDSDGYPFRHTYFYPAEQYDEDQVERLADHCRDGWGEVEIHLHHGAEAPDTSVSTRRQLVEFRDILAQHGCLSQMDGVGIPRYAFVHGNFALANSAGGRWCGVDDEIQILADTGCYADLTMPSAPHRTQIAKTNSLYECAEPLGRRAAHRRGIDLESGRPPRNFPLMIQGPLRLNFRRRKPSGPLAGIENGEVSTPNPPTIRRLWQWKDAAIAVKGRPDWLFVKLHCHGMDPHDEDAMLGFAMRKFLEDLREEQRNKGTFCAHFVTAREMTNIALAACDGRDGNPGDFRDYRLKPIRQVRQPETLGQLEELGKKS